jgi:hypothetical protein
MNLRPTFLLRHIDIGRPLPALQEVELLSMQWVESVPYGDFPEIGILC